MEWFSLIVSRSDVSGSQWLFILACFFTIFRMSFYEFYELENEGLIK